jgi:hypothetical protein
MQTDKDVVNTVGDGSPLPASRQRYAHIKGWGADLDKKDRPAVPMERTPPRLEGVHWEHVSQQPQHVEILHSTERPGITPVFGTTLPPAGLSGRLRRFAFRFSENDVRHWLLLLLADRVNMVEGIGCDLAEGRVPNILAEMGGRAELAYNPGGVARKVVTLALVGAVACLLLRNRRSRVMARRLSR